MKFYRHFSHIKAISFDLDDTLYSNKPVMELIEKKMIVYFANLAVINKKKESQQVIFDYRFWAPFRQQAILKQSDLTNDVVQSRLVTYRLGFIALGLKESDAEQEAQKALAYFVSLRSNVIVPESSKALLAYLSQKYPLIAISNGNVDTKVIGINHYFQHVYHAGWQADGTLLRQKPMRDMFMLACQKLAIKPSQLLHVGDCGRADIQGALLAGCQAAWLSCYDVGKPITILPHIELTQLTQLNLL